MDNTALFNLSYGVFLLATKLEGKVNACITNTCMQVAASPTRVAISVINTNLTCEMLKESGIFSLSMLDVTCPFETIKHFGMQSGHNVDKFAEIKYPEDKNGVPFMDTHTCAVLSCHVVSSQDLGSHTLFIAEIDDAFNLSKEAPMIYAYYQSDVKPKPEKKAEDKKIVGWRCKICGYYHDEPELPKDFECPLCGHPAEDFEPVYEN